MYFNRKNAEQKNWRMIKKGKHFLFGCSLVFAVGAALVAPTVKADTADTGMDLIKYCKDSYSELVHNTTWPNRRELMHSAIVVLVASILIAIVVFAEDTLFERIMNLVYQR